MPGQVETRCQPLRAPSQCPSASATALQRAGGCHASAAIIITSTHTHTHINAANHFILLFSFSLCASFFTFLVGRWSERGKSEAITTDVLFPIVNCFVLCICSCHMSYQWSHYKILVQNFYYSGASSVCCQPFLFASVLNRPPASVILKDFKDRTN